MHERELAAVLVVVDGFLFKCLRGLERVCTAPCCSVKRQGMVVIVRHALAAYQAAVWFAFGGTMPVTVSVSRG